MPTKKTQPKPETPKVMPQEKMFMVPESVMNGMAQIINSLPYGQVAPLAQALGKILAEQQEG
jgi:hypothetical protein